MTGLPSRKGPIRTPSLIHTYARPDKVSFFLSLKQRLRGGAPLNYDRFANLEMSDEDPKDKAARSKGFLDWDSMLATEVCGCGCEYECACVCKCARTQGFVNWDVWFATKVCWGGWVCGWVKVVMGADVSVCSIVHELRGCYSSVGGGGWVGRWVGGWVGGCVRVHVRVRECVLVRTDQGFC